MRSLWFMPVTFLAGQHGFLLFAPYLAAFLAVTHLVRSMRRRRLASPERLPRAAVIVPAAC